MRYTSPLAEVKLVRARTVSWVILGRVEVEKLFLLAHPLHPVGTGAGWDEGSARLQ